MDAHGNCPRRRGFDCGQPLANNDRRASDNGYSCRRGRIFAVGSDGWPRSRHFAHAAGGRRRLFSPSPTRIWLVAWRQHPTSASCPCAPVIDKQGQMVEFALPKNSRISGGKTWPKPAGAAETREFKGYRWNPDDGKNPSVDTYFIHTGDCGPMDLHTL